MGTQNEGYKLMQYQYGPNGRIEVVWNSRDGITPFIIFDEQKHEAQHVNWKQDRYAPDHVPAIGDRVFIDDTREGAEASAARQFDNYNEEWQAAAIERYGSRENFIREIAVHNLSQFYPHPPRIIVVDQFWHDYFKLTRAARIACAQECR